MADFTYDSFGETPIIWWKYMDNIFFIWKHEEECLKQFSSNNKINTQYSKEHIKFLDLNIRLVDAELMADLFVKPFDSNQFLNPSPAYPYHCKKEIPCIQALRLTRIYSENGAFAKYCHNFE